MPDHDLSPAAQAFLTDLSAWLPGDELERARVGLAGLLAGVLKEERARVVCPTCHRTVYRTIGCHTVCGGFPLCDESHIRLGDLVAFLHKTAGRWTDDRLAALADHIGVVGLQDEEEEDDGA
jgi:hypothetical protein